MLFGKTHIDASFHDTNDRRDTDQNSLGCGRQAGPTDTEAMGVRADYRATFYMRDLSIHGFWHLQGAGPGTSTPQRY